MDLLSQLKDTIFNIRSDADFERAALATFLMQAEYNPTYKSFIQALGILPGEINSIDKIPFLPISFFKSHIIKTTTFQEEIIFTSSGTSAQQPSKHFVNNIALYQRSFRKAFELFYGNASDYCILALLPAYLERTGSSLVFMADDLINNSHHPKSGFYLNNLAELQQTLTELRHSKTKTLLLGVSFGLLDLAQLMPSSFHHPELIVMETGGMKGRRKELVRSELHHVLKQAFGTKTIHSEYGMTELLSQAYSMGGGVFQSPPWMKVTARDTTDPLQRIAHKKTGGLNVIDLANLYSCAFLATEDLGKTNPNGTFEVLGRFDTAEIRGCNLMVE